MSYAIHCLILHLFIVLYINYICLQAVAKLAELASTVKIKPPTRAEPRKKDVERKKEQEHKQVNRRLF